jgi:uncharacterized protein (TIGR03435 family)
MNKTSFLVLAAGVALAQQLEFEVATIRPSAGGPGSSVPGLRNGRFSATNASLKALISYAYSMPEMLISGPAWLDSQRFDIAATLPAGGTQDQATPMLQALLEERFHLKVHRENVEMNHYVLTIGKNGPKFKELVPGEPVPPPDFGPGSPSSTQMTNGTISDFADRLGRIMGRPVIDNTTLTGRFHLVIQYAGPNATTPGPDILTAVQEQLGLKVEAQKGPVEILKVDSADKTPTEN